LRILLPITNAFPGTAPMANHAQRLGRALRGAGHEVLIVSPRSPGDNLPLEGKGEFGTPYTSVAMPPKPRWMPHYLYWTHCLRDRLMSRFAQVVKTQGPWDVAILYCDGWSTLDPLRRICHEQGIPVAPYLVEWFAPTLRRVLGLSWIDQWLLHRWGLPRVDGLIGISRIWSGVADLHQLPFQVIPALSKYANDQLPAIVNEPHQRFRTVFVGRWLPRELPGTLLRGFAWALERGANLELIVLGKTGARSEERPALRLLDRLPPQVKERIRLTGWLSDEALQREMASADAFVLLRPDDRESRALFPTRLPEYLATGKPVILSDAGDLAAYVEHGKSAYVLPAGDQPELLAQALIHLSSHPDEARAIGRGGREALMRAFSQEVLGPRLARFLSGLRIRRVDPLCAESTASCSSATKPPR
jgi:glycosyltransferase involved in cell wall biosynthesis